MLKITSANLCKFVYDIISYRTFIYPLELGMCGKKEIISQKKRFSDEIKIFHSFEGKKLITEKINNSRRSFNKAFSLPKIFELLLIEKLML